MATVLQECAYTLVFTNIKVIRLPSIITVKQANGLHNICYSTILFALLIQNILIFERRFSLK